MSTEPARARKLSGSLEGALNSCNRRPKEIFAVCLEITVAGFNPVSVDCDDRVQFISDRTGVKMAGGVDLNCHRKGCKHRIWGRKRYILISKAWVPVDVRSKENMGQCIPFMIGKWTNGKIGQSILETEWQDKTI